MRLKYTVTSKTHSSASGLDSSKEVEEGVEARDRPRERERERERGGVYNLFMVFTHGPGATVDGKASGKQKPAVIFPRDSTDFFFF